MGLLLLWHPSCCLATSLSGLLGSISGLLVEFPRLMVLEDFTLPSLGLGSEVVWEFMAPMTAVNPHHPEPISGHQSLSGFDVPVRAVAMRLKIGGAIQPLSWLDYD